MTRAPAVVLLALAACAAAGAAAVHLAQPAEGDASLGDAPPEVAAPPAVTVEATGARTVVQVGPASATLPLGRATVTWAATDPSGNRVADVQEVTVRDTTPPSMVPRSSSATVAAAGVLTWVDLPASAVGVTVSDAVDPSPVLAHDASTSYFPAGGTAVRWTATDASGNAATEDVVLSVAGSAPGADTDWHYRSAPSSGPPSTLSRRSDSRRSV